MIAAIDTSVLIYAEGVNDAARQSAALEILHRCGRENLIVPAQVLAEFFHVLFRRSGRNPSAASAAVQAWARSPNVAPTSAKVLADAVDLAATNRLQIVDAIILAAAASADADLLLSEAMQDGFAWHGVAVVNPFAARPHRMLAALLR